MNFLDAGCCANLVAYRFDRWPSTYYGMDISLALIDAMRHFAAQEGISVGGLEVAEPASLPFENDFFDIVSVIGVLQYCDLDYCRVTLEEVNRAMKAGARMVLDIPNLDHPYVETMFQLEQYLARPHIPNPRSECEGILRPLFSIMKTDNSRVMVKCFVEAVE